MVRIEVNDHGRIEDLAASGDCIDIAAHLGGAVCALYVHLSQSGTDAGEIFKKSLLAMIQEDGPVWNPNTLLHGGYGHCVVVMPPENCQ